MSTDQLSASDGATTITGAEHDPNASGWNVNRRAFLGLAAVGAVAGVVEKLSAPSQTQTEAPSQQGAAAEQADQAPGDHE